MIRERLFPFTAILLIVLLIWFMLGAPLTKAEFAGIPSQGQMALRQLPVRVQRLFQSWTLLGAEAAASSLSQPVSANASAKAQTSQSINYGAQLAKVTAWPLSIYSHETGETVLMPLETYLIGVIAAEMPASYHLEALKSQAVAARTRAVAQCFALGGNGCTLHAGADICTDGTHCQAYASLDKRKEKWGGEFSAYEARICQAIYDTQNQIMTYNGMPITILYHAVSGGHTEDVEEVFQQSLPYLRGVESTGEEGVSKYEADMTLSVSQAANTLNQAFPNAHLSPESLSQQLKILQVSPTNRVLSIQVGDRQVTGREVRSALNLNSTLFTMSFTETSVTFEQRGYGHGVGMSQAGANAMAANEKGYEEILSHYYQGVTFSILPN